MFDEVVHVAHDLTQLGYKLYATDLTYDYLKDKGVEANLVQLPGGNVRGYRKGGPCLVKNVAINMAVEYGP